jgi:hypothetical protein
MAHGVGGSTRARTDRTLLVAGAALAMLLIGCHTSKPMTPLKSSSEIAGDYEAKIEAVREAALSEFYWPICEVPPKKGKDCGLVADVVLQDDFIAKFVAEVCHEEADAISEDCRGAFRNGYFDQVRKRYTRASESDVSRACASTPDKCKSFVGIELLLLRSHNDAVISEARERIAQLVEEHDREQTTTERARETRARQAEQDRRARAALAGALQGMGQAMSESGSSSSGRTTAAPAPQQVQAPRTCTSDYQCGGPGYVCAKPAGSYTGECAKSVNEFGNQDFMHSPRLDSNGPGKRQCTLPLDCGIGFTCDRGMCIRR